MKKITIGLLFVLLLTACQSTSNNSDAVVIKVASHTAPMTDIVNIAKEEIEAGYTIELVLVNDNVQANIALNNKEVDANFFQHTPFMEQYNAANNGTLVSIQPIYDALVGFYSKNYTALDQLPDGATIGIPNDDANRGRALQILNQAGVITLADGVGIQAKQDDIMENPKQVKFLEVELLMLNQAYEEVDLVFNYPTYIAQLGLKPKDNALLLEQSDGTFAISLVAREDNQDSAAIQALKKAMTSDAVKTFLEDQHGDTTVPSF